MTQWIDAKLEICTFTNARFGTASRSRAGGVRFVIVLVALFFGAGRSELGEMEQRLMLIRVREGPYSPQGDINQEETLEPTGRELWAGTIDELTAAALHAAGLKADPGTWYPIQQFKELVQNANETEETQVFSTISTTQSGVYKPWIANIEIAEQSAALMVCSSVVAHIERLETSGQVWIRVE